MRSIFKGITPGLTAILLILSFSLKAQTLKEFFNSSEVPLVFLGVDFTHAKVLNDITANAMDIRDRQYAAINQVIVNEPKKYDFQKAFNKTNVTNDITQVVAKNSKIDAEKRKKLTITSATPAIPAYPFSGIPAG